MSTHNLYSHIKKYKGDRFSDREVDTVEQLEKIKLFIAVRTTKNNNNKHFFYFYLL